MLLKMEAKLAGAISPAFTCHPVRWFGLIALCSPFVVSEIAGIMDFNRAVSEMEHLGLLPGRPIAAFAILFNLTAVAMVVSGFCRWIGALSLALSTVLTMFIALPFWDTPPHHDRFMVMNAFFEHLGLLGGFLLVGWYDLHKWRRGENDWS